jgi:hypothetical protein
MYGICLVPEKATRTAFVHLLSDAEQLVMRGLKWRGGDDVWRRMAQDVASAALDCLTALPESTDRFSRTTRGPLGTRLNEATPGPLLAPGTEWCK